MSTNIRRTFQLGDLVVAAFDRAGCLSTDPREVSRLAAQALARLLARARWTSISLVTAGGTHERSMS